MKIACLGTGSWGFCLALLLAKKGFEVTCWTTQEKLIETLARQKEHPRFPGIAVHPGMSFTTELTRVVEGADFIVESVTSAGLRPVFSLLKKLSLSPCPVVLTSKGIEQDTGLILSDVAGEVLGEEWRPFIGCLSGPSFAQDVIQDLPASVVASAYDADVMRLICDVFTTPTFRVYLNRDMRGVALGGALKNMIAIACGISDGLDLGHSSRAALMTRGLHEIRRLAVALGAESDTLNGLSGMGDFVLTCNSLQSRNFRFGYLIAQGMSPDEAHESIGMVVEGAYTCVSALQLSQKLQVSMPISEAVYQIVYQKMSPLEAVKALMRRAVKEEHL